MTKNEDIRHIFDSTRYLQPHKQQKMDIIDKKFVELAQLIQANINAVRERGQAIDKLEEAYYYAVRAIAR